MANTLVMIAAGFWLHHARKPSASGAYLCRIPPAILSRIQRRQKSAVCVVSERSECAGVPCRGPRRPQETMLVADYFTEHQLTINELYCALKFRPIPVPRIIFHRWQSFHEPLAAGINLIPDGYVEFMTPAGIIACFLEVDLGHESRTVRKEKARRYLQLALSGESGGSSGRIVFGCSSNAHRTETAFDPKGGCGDHAQDFLVCNPGIGEGRLLCPSLAATRGRQTQITL